MMKEDALAELILAEAHLRRTLLVLSHLPGASPQAARTRNALKAVRAIIAALEE